MFRLGICFPKGAVAVLVFLVTLGSVARAEDSLWTTNFEEAKTRAKAENKLLLVDFTGSDWCYWSVKLKNEVFDKDTFKTEAPKQFVLVELDFPRKKQLPKTLEKQNKDLAKEFNVKGYPAILVLDASGKQITKTGYRSGGPGKYVEHLGELVKAHQSTAPILRQLDQFKGLDRARLLDQLVDAYDKLGKKIEDIKPLSQEIIVLDVDNKAGLKQKHEFLVIVAEANEFSKAQQYEEAKLAYDKALTLDGINGEHRQYAYLGQGGCFYRMHDFTNFVSCLKRAIEAAPDSDKVSDIQAMVRSYGPKAEAQEAVAKIKLQLETAQDPERAELLDQLNDAQTKLAWLGVREPAHAAPAGTRPLPKADSAGIKRQPQPKPPDSGETTAEEVRTWTDTTGGYTLRATLIDCKDGKAELRKEDGTIIWVPLEKLCQPDQVYVRERFQTSRGGGA